jgi:hypothetical protein
MEERRRSLIGNIWFILPVSIIAMVVVGVVDFSAWYYWFSIAISWVIAESILSWFIKGGGGIIIVPAESTHRTVTKGHGYLVFLISIFAVTWISTYVTPWIYQVTGLAVLLSAFAATGTNLPPAQVDLITVALCSGLIGILVFLDLKVRFYTRKGSGV